MFFRRSLDNLSKICAVDAPVRISLELADDTLCLTIDNPVAAQARHRGLGIGTYLAHRLATELGGTLSATRVGDDFRARFAVAVPATRERVPSAALPGQRD